MTIDRALLLRMIDDDEYYKMVGGSADDVVEVLLRAPRPAEASSLDGHQFDTVVSHLRNLPDLADRDRARLGRLGRARNELMAGNYGCIIRLGVLVEVAPVLRSVTRDQLRAEFSRYPRWQKPDVANELDQHLAAFEQIQSFVSETAHRGRSLHAVSESWLDPRYYPHRTRQRLSRLAKQARRAANGKVAGNATVPVADASEVRATRDVVPSSREGI